MNLFLAPIYLASCYIRRVQKYVEVPQTQTVPKYIDIPVDRDIEQIIESPKLEDTM